MSARVAGRAERGGAAGGFRLSVGAAVSVVVAFLTMVAMVALPPVVLAQTPSAELTGLSLSSGTLRPTSAAVSATAASGVTVEYLDASDLTLADADGNTTGFQVDPAVGENAFKVTSGADTETYTVTVERDSAQFAGWTPSRDTHAPVDATAVDPDDWELIPSGLGGGDKFRLLFLSSTSRNASSNNIAGYNTFIQERAAAGDPDIATYSAGFRVVGCTAAVDARDNTGTNKNTDGAGVPIYWVDGSRVADDNADFYDGAWAEEAHDKNESGADGPDTSVLAGYPWTGCNHNGTESFDGADSRALGKSRVRLGRPNETVGVGSGPISSNGLATNVLAHPMYGLSQVFEVAAPLPEVSAGLDLTGTPVTVDEDGSDTFTVALATEPTAEVTVDVTSNDTAAATVSPARLTFATANWDTAQTVTVTGVDDDDSANETLTVTLDADSTDAGYIALGDVTVNVNVVDDGKVPDDWGLIPSGLDTGDKFRLLFLSSTITDATSTDIADYNTFIQNNAAAGHSDIATYSAGFRVVGCTADVDARDNTGTNTDTDGAGVPIYWLDGSRVADDNTDFYDGDWADETNIKNESGTDHPITNQADLPFTGCDHNGTEKFDEISDTGSRALGTASVVLGLPGGTGSASGPLSSISDVANDTQRAMYGLSQVFEVGAGLDLTGTPVTVDENGSNTFTVALATEPTAEVTVDVTSNDTAAATVSTARLTFATSNWDTAQQVTVTGVDDDDSANETLTVTLDADSTDAGYIALGDVTVKVTVVDDGKVPDDWGLIPSGLGDGDKFRLLFLSSTSTDATSTDIADYNTFIQNHAEAGRMELDAYIGGFRAVGCTADVDARDNTGTNTDTDGAGVPIYWLDGIRVADDNTDFYDGDWADETNIKNESGADRPISSQADLPFTGCGHNGTEKFYEFDATESRALGAASVGLALPNVLGSAGPLSSINDGANDIPRPMYGLSQVFEVAAPLPEVSAGLVLTNTVVTVDEDGSDTFTVALATEPTAEVTVDVTSNDTAAATVSTARLTFATSNWDTAQAVTVTGVDDADTADETLTITLDADSISGSDYNTLANVTVNVTVNDDDSAGLVLTGTVVIVDEDGSDTFSVALATEPTAEVTVDVTSNDTAAATVSTARLTFATSNWDTAQAVTVTGVDDADTADETLTITLTADSISDSDYNTLANVTVNVTVNDDDSAGLVLTNTVVTVDEDGSDTFSVALATEPTAEVTVDVTSNDTAAATVSTARLTFATSNWDTAQAVTVTGVDDADTADETLTITLDADSISGSDYNTLANVTVNVTVNDDDSAGLVLTNTVVTVDEDGSDTFSVALATEPTAEVTVDVTSNDTAAATVSTARLTFATSNWDTAQAVTVTGVDDADTADETLTITLDADSISDSDYNTLANVTVNVTVNDDDSAGLVLTNTVVTVDEDGSDTFSVALATEPTAEVTVDVTSNDTAAATVSTARLTFATSNWDTAQAVTVTGVDDADTADETLTITLDADSISDSDYNTLANVTVNVTVNDDDNARDDDGKVLVSKKRLTMPEGGTGSYALVLDKQPAADVVVTIGGHGGTGVSVSPTMHVFSLSNWDMPVDVFVTADTDADMTNESITLTHTTMSTDGRFDAITAPGVIVNVDDKNAPDYHIGTITVPRESYELAPGEKPLPEEQYEVSIGSFGDITGVAEGDVWRPSGLWGDPVSGTVWVVDPYHQGIHSLSLSALKQGRIERRVASDTSELDFRFNYECHFSEDRASGDGNPFLTAMWGTDQDMLIANEFSGTLDVYNRGSAVSNQCITKNVTSWAADGQSYATEDELFSSPYGFVRRFDLTIGPLTVWGIWSDGRKIWLSGPPSGVYTIDLGTGRMAVAPGYNGHGPSNGLWSDETTMWVADESGWLRAYDLNSGARSAEFDIGIRTYGMSPGDIWSDGETIWVTNRIGTIDAYRLPDRLYAGSVAKTTRATEADPLTASFALAPLAHDGENGFKLRIAFSDAVEITPEDMRDHALLVSGATVTDAARVKGRSDLWELTVEPAGPGPVSVLVPLDRACTDPAALCTADGRSLVAVPALVVPGPQALGPPGVPDQPEGTAVFVGGVDLEWDDVPGADSYDVQQWRGGRWVDLPGDGVAIAFYGAGAIISGLDPDASLWFRVRAANTHGVSAWSEVLLLNSTSQFASGQQARPDNQAASGTPVVHGTAQAGEILWADATGIEDGNGLDRVQFRYQWVSGDGNTDTDIAGATDSGYTLAAADVGRTIKVKVTFTDRGGNTETVTSVATGEVAAAPNNPATGQPTITGTALVGETLSVDTSSIADADGLANATYTYQWVANDGTTDTDISGATDAVYPLVADDAGQTIKVKVTFTDDAGNETTLTSEATDTVTAPDPPAKPTGLSAAVSHDAVTLTWDNPQDDSVTGYIILRRDREIHPVGTFITITDDTGTANATYTDDTVEPDKQYVYRIKAINKYGKVSEKSRWIRGFTPTAPAPAG